MRVFEIEADGYGHSELAAINGGCDSVACGCGLNFVGLASGRLSPTARVVDRDLTPAGLDALVRAWLLADLVRVEGPGATYPAEELEQDAADFAGHAAEEAATPAVGAVVGLCWAPVPPDREVTVLAGMAPPSVLR